MISGVSLGVGMWFGSFIAFWHIDPLQFVLRHDFTVQTAVHQQECEGPNILPRASSTSTNLVPPGPGGPSSVRPCVQDRDERLAVSLDLAPRVSGPPRPRRSVAGISCSEEELVRAHHTRVPAAPKPFCEAPHLETSGRTNLTNQLLSFPGWP